MARVYSNAQSKVSTIKSASGDGGCVSTNKGIFIPGVNADGLIYNIIVRRGIEHWPIKYTLLLTRGWVFQERILSPPLIRFEQHEIFWECLSLTTCQCMGIGDAPTEPQELQKSDIGAKQHKYTTSNLQMS